MNYILADIPIPGCSCHRAGPLAVTGLDALARLMADGVPQREASLMVWSQPAPEPVRASFAGAFPWGRWLW